MSVSTFSFVAFEVVSRATVLKLVNGAFELVVGDVVVVVLGIVVLEVVVLIVVD